MVLPLQVVLVLLRLLRQQVLGGVGADALLVALVVAVVVQPVLALAVALIGQLMAAARVGMVALPGQLTAAAGLGT